MVTEDEKKELIRFLKETKTILQNIVDARHVLFRKDLRKPIEDAWIDVEKLIDESIDDLKTTDIVLENKLVEAGLTGNQLVFKIKGFDGALKRFENRGTVNLLDKLLKWINTILKSLIVAIPGAEGIKEFKESLEAEIDDEDPII